MISLIPAVAGRRTDVTMSQQTSQATQERIDELIRRTQEKEEERKKKRRKLQAGEATTSCSSQERQSEPTKGQETTIATSKAGHTVLIKHTRAANQSGRFSISLLVNFSIPKSSINEYLVRFWYLVLNC